MKSKIYKIIARSAILSASIIAAISDVAIADETNSRGITVTIEAPEVQSTLLLDASQYYVIDFEDQSGANTFSKTNGSTTYSYSGDLQVKDSNEFGGANVSKFITQNQNSLGEFLQSYQLTVNEDQKYFGFWWSAGDPYNEITFKNDGVTVASFRTEDLVNFIDSSGVVTTVDYLGNPNSVYNTVESNHKTQPFSFVNVFFNDDSVYDEIIVTSDYGNSAFESDHHTFSAIKQAIRGTVVLNNAPVANDDIAATTIYNSIVIDALGNDTDGDGDPITLTSIDSIFGGNAVIEDNKIVYTADSTPGEFSLTYTVLDDFGKTDSGNVTITVTAFPD